MVAVAGRSHAQCQGRLPPNPKCASGGVGTRCIDQARVRSGVLVGGATVRRLLTQRELELVRN